MENTSRIDAGRIIGLLAALVLLASAFLPWAKTDFFSISGIQGLEGDGVITVGIAVVAAILLLIKKVPLWITIILGILTVVIGIMDFQGVLASNDGVSTDILSSEIGDSIMIKAGIGLYMTIIAGAGLIVGPIVSYVSRKKVQ